MSERDGTSAAKRRRERRQRSWWKHEQLSVKVALSAPLHHSRVVGPESHEAPQGQRTDRAEEEEVREENQGPRGQTRPPSGTRPEWLPAALGPQGGRSGAGGLPVLQGSSSLSRRHEAGGCP